MSLSDHSHDHGDLHMNRTARLAVGLIFIWFVLGMIGLAWCGLKALAFIFHRLF